MQGIELPFLLSGTSWLVASALSILLLLVVYGYHIYQRSRVKALLGDAGDISELAARKEQLQADVNTLKRWIADQRDELQLIEGERRQQEVARGELSQLEQDLAAARQEKTSFYQEMATLEYQKDMLRQTYDSLRKEHDDLQIRLNQCKTDFSAAQSECHAKQNELEALKQQVSEAQNRLDNIFVQERKLSFLESESARLEEKISRTQEALAPLASEKEALDQTLQKQREQLYTLNHTKNTLEQDIEEKEARRSALQAAVDKLTMQAGDQSELEQKLAELRQALTNAKVKRDELAEESSHIESRKARLQDELAEVTSYIESRKARLQDELDKLAAAADSRADLEHECDALRQEFNAVRQRKEELEQDVAAKEARQATLAREIELLEAEADERRDSAGTGAVVKSATAEALQNLMEDEPACMNLNAFKGAVTQNRERDLLDGLQSTLSDEGYHFHERTLHAFHTSLKINDISPLTVLAGVSGTGKTLLPVRYAEYMGMHKLVISVQPRWDSPQDMFGFYNYLEKKYKATDFSRMLVRMDPYNFRDRFEEYQGARNGLMLVLLDEMNLARTEYYFSEFLSKLELRRTVTDPADPVQRSLAEVDLDAGPGRPVRVWVPNNILFVGTMNEDESTQTLSDKVLDRANVLRFGKPAKPGSSAVSDSGSRSRRAEQYLPYKTWHNWQQARVGANWERSVNGWIDQANEAMDLVGRPFGFRVRQAIMSYVANYPDVNSEERHKLAFSDQLQQKILPKLRGLDMNESDKILPRMQKLLREVGDSKLEQSFTRAIQESRELGMFYWRGVTY